VNKNKETKVYSKYPIPSHDYVTGIENPYYPKFACEECCESNLPEFYSPENRDTNNEFNDPDIWRWNRIAHLKVRCPVCGMEKMTYTTDSYRWPQFHMLLE
jgi:hypothetical protein